VLASKLSTNAKFQNMQDLTSRTFQRFASTFKHLICFQALSRASKFLFQIQAFSRISHARYEPCWKEDWLLVACSTNGETEPQFGDMEETTFCTHKGSARICSNKKQE